MYAIEKLVDVCDGWRTYTDVQAFMNDCMDSYTASMQQFVYHQLNNYACVRADGARVHVCVCVRL